MIFYCELRIRTANSGPNSMEKAYNQSTTGPNSLLFHFDLMGFKTLRFKYSSIFHFWTIFS